MILNPGMKRVAIGKNSNDKEMSNKKVLVTGSSGMIGSHLVQSLMKDGYEVVGLDLKNGTIKNDNFSFHSVDLGDINAIESVFEEEKPDRVIHLAALAHPLGKSDLDFKRITHINVECAENIFSVAENHRTPLLFISTVDVLGMTRGLITPSTTPNPVTDYGITKFQAENKLKEISSSYDIFRFSPVYTADIKRDIQKRYYLKPPKWAYRIGKGGLFEVLDIRLAVKEMTDWVEKEPTNSLRIIKDEKLLDVNELIEGEKAEGRANHVLYFPRWMVMAGYYCLYPILRKSNPSYLIFKALWPFRTNNN